MTTWHLAQINVARPLEPLDTPRLAEFVAKLDEINALADISPGFVWRLAGATGNATDIQAPDPTTIVNMSVWTSPETLFEFVYKTAHTKVMVRRREWFDKIAVYQVLWWIPAGHVPTVDEGLAKLALLEQQGPTPAGFTFKQRFGVPGSMEPPTNMRPEPYCV
jgi:hypothetical protein